MSSGVWRFFYWAFCLTHCWPGLGAASQLRVVRQWAALEFAFPSEEARQAAIEKRYYIPGRSVPMDVDVHYIQNSSCLRIFVTVARFDEGRPITLGTLDEEGRIHAYPDYSWHDNQGCNCDGITSVYRVAIDECNRLWVMDTGKISGVEMCPPQLLAFDLNTDQLIYRHRLNSTSYVPSSLFATPVVDLRRNGDDCSDTFVYVADVSGFGLLVVDVANDRSWRITHRYFYPYPQWGSFRLGEDSFDVMDGVLGMALTPYKPGVDRTLYFHALSAVNENVVPTSLLRNSSFIDDPNAPPNSIISLPEDRPNQSVGEAMDRDGILYFGQMEPPSIWCWNSATKYSKENLHPVAINRGRLQFSSGVKIVNNFKGEQELWVLSCRYQKVATNTLRTDTINFRILKEKIPVILKNSPCALPKLQSPCDHYLNEE